MAIYMKPGERIIAYRIDEGPWCFDEGPLKLWRVAGPIIEVREKSNGKEPVPSSERGIGGFLKLLLKRGA